MSCQPGGKPLVRRSGVTADSLSEIPTALNLKPNSFFNIQKLLAQNAAIVSNPKLTTCKRPNSFPPQAGSKF
jgi:hypothetical protein